MSSTDYEFEQEKYESYYGDALNVLKIMENCKDCGGRLVNNYLADYKNLYIKEQVRCGECGGSNIKRIHQLN